VTTPTATVFRDTHAILVESIYWDASTDELRWADITAGTLHRGRLDDPADGSRDWATRLPPPLPSFQPTVDGGFVAALGDRVVLLDEQGTIVQTLAQIEHAHPDMRLNEGKCDPFGRFVVGSMGVTRDDPDAAVYSVDPDGTLRTLHGGFGVTNGFEWSDDGSIMYLTDTSTSTVYRADYSPDGALGELEPFLVGQPSDGLALDTDGNFWNGLSGAGKVVRWDAEGDITLEIEVPVPNVTSVAFGGPGLGTLFIGTSRDGLAEEDLQSAPLSGGIFRVDGLATGRPVNRFGSAPSNPS